MIALFKYYLIDYARSYRYFPPIAALLLIISVNYSAPKPIPILSSYAFTAGLVFVICGWLSVTYLNTEDPVQTQIVQTHTGSTGKVYIGRLLVLFALAAAVSLFAVAFPIVTLRFSEPMTVYKLVMGGAGHLISALLGAMAGSFFCDLFISKISYSWSGLVLVWTVSIGAKGIHDSLPAILNWLYGLLPPVSMVIQTLLDAEAGAAPASSAAMFRYAYGVVYTGLLMFLFLKLVTRDRDRGRVRKAK